MPGRACPATRSHSKTAIASWSSLSSTSAATTTWECPRPHGLGPAGCIRGAAVLLGEQGRRQPVSLVRPELEPAALTRLPDPTTEPHLGHAGVEDRAQRLLRAEPTRVSADGRDAADDLWDPGLEGGIGAHHLLPRRARACRCRIEGCGGGRRAAGEHQGRAGEQAEGESKGPRAIALAGHGGAHRGGAYPEPLPNAADRPDCDGAHRTRVPGRCARAIDHRRRVTLTSLPW